MSTGGWVQDQLLLGRVSDIGHPGRDANAVWVRDGRIAAVGGQAVIDRAVEAGAKVHDLGDAIIAPGFIDPHAHVEAYATAVATSVDLRFPTVRTIPEVLHRLERAVAGSDDGWVVAQANLFWDRKLAERRYPTREELDAVSATRPIAIRAGGHVSILNSAAIAAAGLESYEGRHGMMGRAVIERDREGSLTGVIAELDALLPLGALDGDDLAGAIRRTLTEDFAKRGVTTVGEIVETQAGGRAIAQMGRAGTLPTRVAQYLWTPGAFALGEIDEALASGDYAGGWVEPIGLKVFADGGYSSRNAAVLTPYLGTGSATESATGDLNLAPEDIAELLDFAHDRALQLIVHTNGERAQHMVLDAAEAWKAARGDVTGWPGRLRLEHAGNVMSSSETARRLIRARVPICTQPTFIYSFSGLLPEILGAPVEQGRHPYRSLVDAGVLPAASSDIHMGAEPQQMDPFFGIWCAVARRSYDGAALEPSQAISVREAMTMYTLSAARALGMEHRLGSVTPGKAADFAILSTDPTTLVDVDDIRNVRVMDTWVAGASVVHGR